MIPALVPKDIIELHSSLLAALGVDYFPPGMADMNAWRDFLFVMQPLADSAGGAMTKADLPRAVDLMRQQNKSGDARWSLRFSKIMREPEAFRDLVLIARKKQRPRPPIETASRTDASGAAIQVERNPAAESEPQPISEGVRRFMSDFEAHKAAEGTTCKLTDDTTRTMISRGGLTSWTSPSADCRSMRRKKKFGEKRKMNWTTQYEPRHCSPFRSRSKRRPKRCWRNGPSLT